MDERSFGQDFFPVLHWKIIAMRIELYVLPIALAELLISMTSARAMQICCELIP